jgi:hypothetical protein
VLTACLSCGTGNQMFEYAMAYAQAKRLGIPLRLDVTHYTRQAYRGYNLGLWEGVKEARVMGIRPTVCEQGMPYSAEIVTKLKDGDCLEGYWQTEKYFADVREDLLRIFRPRYPFTPRAKSLLQEISKAGESSVMVSVRRTDRIADDFGPMTREYYLTACNRVAERVKNPHFFVFSDDPEWCQRYFKIPYPCTVVSDIDMTTANHLGREDEDIWAMSCCYHAILSNSSFAWWGAWLSTVPDEDRVVIAPRPWFIHPQYDSHDVVPKRWATASRKSGKVLVALISCNLHPHIERTKFCLDTWGCDLPEGFDLKVCTGANLSTSEQWGNRERMKAIATYALDHGYDWVLKTDDDTDIRFYRLKIPHSADYAGWVTWKRNCDWPREHCQGGCYWLSRRSLEVIERESIEDSYDLRRLEDRWVEMVLSDAGIKPVHLPDFVMNPTWKWRNLWRPSETFDPNWAILLQADRSGDLKASQVKTSTSNRVCVGLISCDSPKYKIRQQQCLNTWAKSLPLGYDLKLCTGKQLSVPDDYGSLCEKVKAAVKYALEQGYDWFLKVDDDTELRPNRLNLPTGAEYAGWVTTVTTNPSCTWIHCQGGCYWLSRKAMRIIAKAEIGPFKNEDNWVAKTLREHDILPVHLDDFVVAPSSPLVSGWRPEAIYTPEWTALIASDDRGWPSGSNQIIQSLWWPSLGTMEKLSVASYLACGHEFHVYSYGPCANVPRGTMVKDANEILPESEVSRFKHLAHFGDWFRYNLLYQKGGWWVDIDTVCLRAFTMHETHVCSGEDNTIARYCNNAYLKAPVKSEFMKWCIDRCKMADPMTMAWATTANDLVTEGARKFDIAVHVPAVFNPVPYWNWERLISANTENVPTEAYAVHLWRDMWKKAGKDRDATYPATSLYEHLKQRYLDAPPQVPIPQRHRIVKPPPVAMKQPWRIHPQPQIKEHPELSGISQ